MSTRWERPRASRSSRPVTGDRPANRRAVVAPKQARSRESYERVLRATDELLHHRSFAEITVNEICIAAETSPSSLYGRFVTKDAVLATLYQQHVEAAHESLTRTLLELSSEVADDSDRIESMLRALLGEFLAFCRANAHIMTSIWEDEVLREEYWRMSNEMGESITGAAVAIIGIDDPELRRHVEFGTRIAASSFQRAIGLPVSFGERLGFDDREIVERMTQMLAGYFERVTADGA